MARPLTIPPLSYNHLPTVLHRNNFAFLVQAPPCTNFRRHLSCTRSFYSLHVRTACPAHRYRSESALIPFSRHSQNPLSFHHITSSLLPSVSLTSAAAFLTKPRYTRSAFHKNSPNRLLAMSLQDNKSDKEAMLFKGHMIQKKLEELYPDIPEGFLDHADPFTLLVSVMLSAQATDVSVNLATPELFKQASTPKEMVELGQNKVYELIKSIGLAKTKAKHIIILSEQICEDFKNEVPKTMEELETLAGVGHKTASVVLQQAFGIPTFPVDTHIHRLACRWGCGKAKSVSVTEKIMKQWFPYLDTWGGLHRRFILFGRQHCPARNHDMDGCPICSFAATVEARAANKAHSSKFVAANSHANPYSVREVGTKNDEVDDEMADDIAQVTISTPKKGRKAAVKGKTGAKRGGKKAEAPLVAKEEASSKPAKKMGRPTKAAKALKGAKKDVKEEKAVIVIADDVVDDDQDGGKGPKRGRKSAATKSGPAESGDSESRSSLDVPKSKKTRHGREQDDAPEKGAAAVAAANDDEAGEFDQVRRSERLRDRANI